MKLRAWGRDFFDEAEIERLRTPHAHRSVDLSLISRLLEPFWTFVAGLMPRWLAPNAITLSGFALVALSAAAMLLRCPTLRGAAPASVYVASIASIFAFQTLDAVDGKQARRTGTSSMLGGWFDHALDVAAVQLAMLTAAASLGLGPGGATLFLLGSVVFNNYVLHWETCHTGTLHLGNGTSIYEAQATMMAIHALTLVFGAGFWDLRFAGIALRLWVIGAGVGLIGGIGILGSFGRVVRAGGGQLGVFAELLPPAILCLAGAAAVSRMDEGASLPVVLSVSLLGLRQIAHQILNQLAGSRVPRFDPMLVPFCVSAVLVFRVALPADTIRVIVWGNLAFATVVTLGMYLGATFAIARALGVPILTVPTSSRRA